MRPHRRAAKRLSETTGVEAETIHGPLEVNLASGGFTRNEARPLECDLLVVEETSMVDVLLMNSLLRALPAHAGLLLVGDVDQVPSVGPVVVLRSLIDSGVVPVVRLTEVFHQAAHSRIITMAHRINEGMMPETPAKEAESDFYFIDRAEPEAIAATLVEMVKTRIPAKFRFDPVREIQVLCPMNRGLLGIRELNVRLQNELNPARADEPVVEKFGWPPKRGRPRWPSSFGERRTFGLSARPATRFAERYLTGLWSIGNVHSQGTAAGAAVRNLPAVAH